MSSRQPVSYHIQNEACYLLRTTRMVAKRTYLVRLEHNQIVHTLHLYLNMLGHQLRYMVLLED